MIADFTPCENRKMLENPNWRYHQKEKWMDKKHKGIIPSYKNFGRKTANGFHIINRGILKEPNGNAPKSSERYDPYINGLHELGHKFRCRKSHKEISPIQFITHTSKDIIMKNSTFKSTSIRSTESESRLKFAKEKFQKYVNPRYSIDISYNKNFRISTEESDYDFDSPKLRKGSDGALHKYKLSVNQTSSESLNNDLPLIGLKSTRTIQNLQP